MLNSVTVWSALIIYSLLVAALGIYAWRKQQVRTTRNYYTGKGSISSLVLVMTYIASLMSTWVFFAGPGGYYRGGFSFYLSELSYIPLFPVVAYFVMNKVWMLNSERGYTTPADVYDDRFRSPLLRVILAVVFLAASFPYVASVLVAGGRAAAIASGGAIADSTVIVIMTVVMLVYVILGGMRSVAWTDTFQGWTFIILLWSIILGTLYVGFGGSLLSAVTAVWQTTNEWFSYPGPDHWVPYAARLGYPLSCAIGWTIMLPHVFVRAAYSGQDLVSQRRLMGYVPVLQTLVWTGTMLIGLLAMALVPGLSGVDTELIIPLLVSEVINPAGPQLAAILMTGFFIGAIAVGMSTANSFLLVSGSIVSEDIVTKIFKIKLGYEKKMLVARVVILVLGAGSMFLALKPPELIWTLIMFAIALVMPLFPVLVGAIYWERATPAAAVVSVTAGVITVLLTYFVWEVGWMWYGTFGVLVSAVLLVVVSYITPETEREILDEFYGALKQAEQKYYKN